MIFVVRYTESCKPENIARILRDGQMIWIWKDKILQRTYGVTVEVEESCHALGDLDTEVRMQQKPTAPWLRHTLDRISTLLQLPERRVSILVASRTTKHMHSIVLDFYLNSVVEVNPTAGYPATVLHSAAPLL